MRNNTVCGQCGKRTRTKPFHGALLFRHRLEQPDDKGGNGADNRDGNQYTFRGLILCRRGGRNAAARAATVRQTAARMERRRMGAAKYFTAADRHAVILLRQCLCDRDRLVVLSRHVISFQDRPCLLSGPRCIEDHIFYFGTLEFVDTSEWNKENFHRIFFFLVLGRKKNTIIRLKYLQSIVPSSGISIFEDFCSTIIRSG